MDSQSLRGEGLTSGIYGGRGRRRRTGGESLEAPVDYWMWEKGCDAIIDGAWEVVRLLTELRRQ